MALPHGLDYTTSDTDNRALRIAEIAARLTHTMFRTRLIQPDLETWDQAFRHNMALVHEQVKKYEQEGDDGRNTLYWF